MDDAALGRSVRMLRHRRDGVRRTWPGALACLPAPWRLIERGQVDRLSLRLARQVASAIGLRLGWDVGARAAEVARLADADHARCTDLIMRRLDGLGWATRAEVSFNEYGDRGRIDVLAFHPPTAALLVIEIKTPIVDAQELLGGMDVKQRVGIRVARSIGLPAKVAVPMLAVLKTTTNRRRIDQHPHLFGRFTLRGRRASAWLRSPSPLSGGLLVTIQVPDRKHADVRRAGRQRVRLATRRASVRRAPERPDSPPERA